METCGSEKVRRSATFRRRNNICAKLRSMVAKKCCRMWKFESEATPSPSRRGLKPLSKQNREPDTLDATGSGKVSNRPGWRVGSRSRRLHLTDSICVTWIVWSLCPQMRVPSRPQSVATPSPNAAAGLELSPEGGNSRHVRRPLRPKLITSGEPSSRRTCFHFASFR